MADIVQACSDTDARPTPPWRARKEAYIAHLRDPALPAGTLRVSLADKVDNARAILFDLQAGHDVYSSFSAPRDQQLCYYDALATTFAELTGGPMVAELRHVIEQLDAVSSASVDGERRGDGQHRRLVARGPAAMQRRRRDAPGSMFLATGDRVHCQRATQTAW